MEYYYWLCFSIVGGVLALGWIPILILIWRGSLNRVPKMTKLPWHHGYQPQSALKGDPKPPPKKR
ncbi:hypothetical protein [Pantoea ananatis]|uniref:hypothetical protein n=1 Tax=Pantoea ananas TaxID=553 RepID=UPI001B31642C|nr:hypothetical protein [Pantoea ananatis]